MQEHKNLEEKDWAAAMDADRAYLSTQSRDHRRKFAQFFTPDSAANIMASWVAEKSPERVLDPAYGTGILARTVFKLYPDARFVGYEIDPEVARHGAVISQDLRMSLDLRVVDFLDSPHETYMGIIANPPYLKHHDFPAGRKHIERLRKSSGILLSGMTNAYALFLVECLQRLAPGGRAAFVIPTEWMNANFGAPIRSYLLSSGVLKAIVHVAASKNLFEDALTTASVLLFENDGHTTGGVHVFSTDEDITALHYSEILESPDCKLYESDVLAREDKWENFIISGKKHTPLGFVPLSTLAYTRRGLATGANGFFLISKNQAEKLGISEKRLLPCIGKAAHVKYYDFRKIDHVELNARGAPAYLINFTGDLSEAEMSYLKSGEAQAVHERYLTRKRKPWYGIDRSEVAPIWAAVFGRDRIRFIRNSAGFLNLTTFHGIYPHVATPRFSGALTACLNSSVVQDLIKHDLRAYGGGLNKMEPRDLLKIPVPDLRNAPLKTLTALADFVEKKRIVNFSLEELKRLDEVVRSAALGSLELLS